jgi:hypothetical protein
MSKGRRFMDQSTKASATEAKTAPARIDLLARTIVRRRTRIDADAIAARLIALGWPDRLI